MFLYSRFIQKAVEIFTQIKKINIFVDLQSILFLLLRTSCSV